MGKKEVPIDLLQHRLPPGTYEPVLAYLQQFKVHLTITRERKTILGDYRHRTHINNHRISINGNLNIYSFLITLLHELAHLLTFEQYGNKVQSHGWEWKMVYARLLDQFLKNKIFPYEIERELFASLSNPAASSCAEDGLIRVLRKYNKEENGNRLLEELPYHALFRIDDGRVFQRGEKLRKRYQCTEVKTGKIYLFSPVHEVELV